jgi:hypothetical protein
MARYKLSPSTLNLFIECPRCFWLHINKGVKRPKGIFPSLPGGMDTVIKKYFDKYRVRGLLPPEIDDRVSGKLFDDIKILEKWRDWRSTDLCYEDETLNASLSGALDDCIVDNGYYIPLDYKTRGYELKDDPRTYYQNQLDCYCLMLESRGYKTKGISYLIYYYPKEVREKGIVEFIVEPIKIETNVKTAREIFEKAITVLNKALPNSSSECEYCGWERVK